MIRQLLELQQSALSLYFKELDCKKTEEILDAIESCRGTLILSGVGKSGHIAEKIAATFLSVGVRAFYLDPTKAIHGDLGYLREEDLFLAFSKSGESDELLGLLPFIHKRGVKSISIVSQERSRLSKESGLSIVLPLERELCPFDFAPTTSTAIQLLFGDLLAVALMKTRKLSLSDYAMNHPGGFIGRCISLKVSDLMLEGNALPLCFAKDLLIEELHELSLKRCGCLLIVDEEEALQGIFTDGDLRRALETKGAKALESTLGELMTLHPRTITPQTLAMEAMRQMEEDAARLIMALPVVDEGRLVGLLRMHDVVQAGLLQKVDPNAKEITHESNRAHAL
jgi:arabinose-5-phosphate isomerase